MKVDILAFGAHPDDVELGCGGTIHSAVQKGKSVGIIDLTKGELGSRGNSEIRTLESENAAKILGVNFRQNLGLPDGFIFNTKENQLKAIRSIRQHQPEIVFCNAIEDRHSDHPKASKLIRDACFLSGLKKIKTKGEDALFQNPWRPRVVYSYIQWRSLIPDFVVDISDSMEVKLRAAGAYKSQFYDPNKIEPQTPISSQNFLESIRYRAADFGRLTNTDYAEGFKADRLLAVNSIFDLK